ncbi:hypothetical protein POM88_053400 [Heracleum sosnowskyi]|uniref:Uncharacterized protein n=1 Tax=Heracleum sosnowskyi TaxID=360622 RepID=A0AAD8GPW9_9APIA|nr:hypothetical protein POM88_053400 [Heracleum sosnowskyi]
MEEGAPVGTSLLTNHFNSTGAAMPRGTTMEVMKKKNPKLFAVLEDPEQEEAKMPDLDTAEPEEIAQDECLGNKAEEGVVKEITPEESDLAHRSENLEERSNAS